MFILMLLAIASTAMFAQRGGPMPHFHARPSGFGPGFGHGGRGGFLYPVPFYDPLGWDYAAVNTAPAQPQVVVVQPPQPKASETIPAPAEPLMIELRGNSYVQVSGNPDSQSQMLRPATNTEIRAGTLTEADSAKLARHQAALLVFRDGHREDVSDYTIANGVLYAKGDFYSNGRWNRSIAMSSLNVPETIHANESRGLTFRVPDAPNEVVVGP